MLAPLRLDETVEWCNSFITVPKPNGIVPLYLHSMRLNQALIKLVHRGLTINDILSKLKIHANFKRCEFSYQNMAKIILPNHTCMLVWQVQIYQTTIWGSFGG